MSFTTDPTPFGHVLERDFVVQTDGLPVSGVHREPVDGPADRLVLLGHGGTVDKRTEYVMQISQLLAERGIASMAIDGPGHGDRATFEFTGRSVEFEQAWTLGGGTPSVLSDWRVALDFIEAECGARPTGWWGLSMGTMMGLPVAVADDRIACAVFGLMGVEGINEAELRLAAPRLSCPVQFLVQWDDEVVSRDSCLELFDLLGSEKKTLHANPGVHVAVPTFEFSGTVDFLDRTLH